MSACGEPARQRRTDILLLAAVATIGLLLAFCSERIPVNGGLGMDGESYARIAMNAERILAGDDGIPALRASRLLPSLFCAAALRMLGAARSPAAIILFFRVYDLALLLLAAWGWILICRSLAISERGRWLGMIGFFVNHAILKYGFYYPVLTDFTAFTVALFMLYAFLSDRAPLLFALAAAGAFTWPTLLPLGTLLFCFPRRAVAEQPPRGLRHIFLSALLVLLFGILTACGMRAQGPTRIVISSVAWLPFNLVPTLGYLFFAFAALFRSEYYLSARSFLSGLAVRRVPWIVLLAGAVLVAGRALALSGADAVSDAPGNNATAFSYLAGLLWDSALRPGEFLVAHPMYFGPFILLAAIYWSAVASAVRGFGWGAVLAVSLALFLLLQPISRQSMGTYPILVPFIVLVLERVPLTRGFLVLLGVLSIGYAKVWMRFNCGNEMNWDRYTSSIGWYMKNAYFYGQAGLIALTLLAFWLYLRRLPTAPSSTI